MCATGRQGRDRPDTWLGYMYRTGRQGRARARCRMHDKSTGDMEHEERYVAGVTSGQDGRGALRRSSLGS